MKCIHRVLMYLYVIMVVPRIKRHILMFCMKSREEWVSIKFWLSLGFSLEGWIEGVGLRIGTGVGTVKRGSFTKSCITEFL